MILKGTHSSKGVLCKPIVFIPAISGLQDKKKIVLFFVFTEYLSHVLYILYQSKIEQLYKY